MKNKHKRKNHVWETIYKIKKQQNEYCVSKKAENNRAKIISAIILITLILIVLTIIHYLFGDSKLMESILKISDSYIFIGLTTFIIFLLFNGNKREYNVDKKGDK